MNSSGAFLFFYKFICLNWGFIKMMKMYTSFFLVSMMKKQAFKTGHPTFCIHPAAHSNPALNSEVSGWSIILTGSSWL